MQTIHNPLQDRIVDYNWFLVRTQPNQEARLEDAIREYQQFNKNILEVYCPRNTTVRIRKRSQDVKVPFYTGYIFVYATFQALSEFINQEYPEASIQFSRKKMDDGDDSIRALCLTVPEKQMAIFRDFIDSYHDQMVLLDRPYTDYAFSPKKGEYNEVVKIVEGPFAGRTGFVARFDGDKRLVFNLFDYEKDSVIPVTISIPNLWAFQLVRLTNIKDHRVGDATQRDRAIDRILGTIQACGYGDEALIMLDDMVTLLCNEVTWSGLCKFLRAQQMNALANAFAGFSKEDVALIFSLIRYERENPGTVHHAWRRNFIRPFLTPTSGFEDVSNILTDKTTRLSRQELYAALTHTTATDYAALSGSSVEENVIKNESYDEIIRKVSVRETFYDADQQKEIPSTTTYYAHIGKMTDAEGNVVLFANWDKFLREYFLTDEKANAKLVAGMSHQQRSKKSNRVVGEKLLESFRNYVPTLYMILRNEEHPVKAVENLSVGTHLLNAFAITLSPDVTGEILESRIQEAEQTLITTLVSICEEITSSAHLAIWRRYLSTVWLHI